MTPSTLPAMPISAPASSPTSSLEARLRKLIVQTLGLDPDQLVGYLSRNELGSERELLPVRARAWLGRARTRRPRLGRVFMLDPYSVQVLIEDAQRAGRGMLLDVVLGRDTPASVTGDLRRRLAALERRGVDVRVRMERSKRGAARRLQP
jgi:hypothetical protein